MTLRRWMVMMTAAMQGAGAAAVPTYAEILRDTYGASEIYPLTNIPSGTDIHAFISAAHDGTLTLGTGAALQDSVGPVSGGLAPLFDGATGLWNIGSIAVSWNGAIGSFSIYGKAANAGVWTDGISRYLAVPQADANNRFLVSKPGASNLLQIIATIGGVSKAVNISTSTTDWFMITVTWKDSANGDEVKVYFNDSQSGATQTGFGAWSGALSLARLGSIGQDSGVWDGWLAYSAFKFGSVWSPTDVANIYADRLTGGPDINP